MYLLFLFFLLLNLVCFVYKCRLLYLLLCNFFRFYFYLLLFFLKQLILFHWWDIFLLFFFFYLLLNFLFIVLWRLIYRLGKQSRFNVCFFNWFFYFLCNLLRWLIYRLNKFFYTHLRFLNLILIQKITELTKFTLF